MYAEGDSKFRSNIISFATQKLLCNAATHIDPQFNPQSGSEQTLACLSVRLSLEFKTTPWLNRRSTSDIERRQIERHMRVCLAATPGLREMVTNCPSEPLLAEAA